MSKKNRNRRIKNKKSIDRYKYIKYIVPFIGLIMMGLQIFYLKEEKSILVIKSYNVLKFLLGDLYTWTYVYIFVYTVYKAVFSKYEFLFHKKIKYFIISNILYIIGYTSLVYNVMQVDNNLPFLEIIRNVLRLTFENIGTGLIGSIPTVLVYKFSSYKYYYLIIYTLFSISIILFLSNVIKFFFIAFIKWLRYIRSDKYRMKKRQIKLSKKLAKVENDKKIDNIAEKVSTYVINKVESNLEKEYQKDNDMIDLSSKKDDLLKINEKEVYNIEKIYDAKEIEKKYKLQEEEEKVEKIEEDIENTRLNEIEEFEEEEILEEIVDENIEENNENEENEEVEEKSKPEIKDSGNIEKIDQEKIKKEIENIFVNKYMDESEKLEMLAEIEANKEKLLELFKVFKIEANIVSCSVGPTITRYELTIPLGTQVKKVTALTDEIAMGLAAESVRIEAPIPGKSAIGIEIPNKKREPVYFSNIIKSKEFNNKILPVVIGKNVIGENKVLDVVKMPHLLVAGTTGSGKSVFINSLISSIISKKSYEEVKFILIDPKMVELSLYNGIPHLLLEAITDPKKAAIALNWAVNEMERRYKLLAELGLKNIKDYNEKYQEKMPYLIIVIDELADLMMVSSNTVETSIARITQKARAIGIHLIVATQRPSTDVITGLIKANLPSRISFALRSNTDSRVILDSPGAEKLLGNGDMLLLENGTSKLERVQGAYISDAEIEQITKVLKDNVKVKYDYSILEEPEESFEDPLYGEVLKYIENLETNIVVGSKLQQEFKIGFNRASRILSELRKNQVINESNEIL